MKKINKYNIFINLFYIRLYYNNILKIINIIILNLFIIIFYINFKIIIKVVIDNIVFKI